MSFSLTENTAESLGFDPVPVAAPASKWPWENDPANADATPDYQYFLHDGWSLHDWMAWHASLKACYGGAQANAKFATAWKGGNIFVHAPINDAAFGTYAAEFRSYAAQQGFADAIFDDFDQAAWSTTHKIGDAITAGVNAIGSAADGAKNTLQLSALLKYLIPVAAVGALLLWLWPYIFPAYARARAVTAQAAPSPATSRKKKTRAAA